MQGKWVPVRGHVGSGRRLQTCTTKENAISAFVRASSLPHRLSKSSAGACPPPLGNAIISQLSCLLEFIVSSLPKRWDGQFGSFLSEGLGPQTKWVPMRESAADAGCKPALPRRKPSPPLSSPARSHNISRNVARGLVPRLFAKKSTRN